MFTKKDLAYSNQLHQLLVTVSRHLYVQKDGNLKYQEKPLDIDITRLPKSRKEHLVYYVLKDAFSGTFVFELATSRSLPSLADFLFRAWRKDAGKYLWGLPDYISIPRSIASPQLMSGLQKLGLQCFHPSSGFTSGVRVLRDIEDHLAFLLGRIVDHRPGNINRHYKEKIYNYLLKLGYGDMDKFKIWQANLPTGHSRETPDREEFMALFQDAGQPVAGVNENLNNEENSGLWPPVSREKLAKAEELVYEAEETYDREKSLNLARKALRLSPYCVDAYNLLARESSSLNEKIALYEQAVQAGELLLGESFFKERQGHFWGFPETRPYMRAMYGHAATLWKLGRKDEAIKRLWEMLRLNPNDNQGIRYTLSGYLLEEGRDGEMQKLMARYGDEATCFITWNMALWTFRTTDGSNDRSDALIKAAVGTNDFVPAYLLGQKYVPYRLPDYYSPGGDEEAVIYAAGAKKAWEKTPGALAWLAHEIKRRSS